MFINNNNNNNLNKNQKTVLPSSAKISALVPNIVAPDLRLARINVIISQVQNGSMTVEAAVIELKNIGLEVKVQTTSRGAVIEFNYKNKHYSITARSSNSNLINTARFATLNVPNNKGDDVTIAKPAIVFDNNLTWAQSTNMVYYRGMMHIAYSEKQLKENYKLDDYIIQKYFYKDKKGYVFKTEEAKRDYGTYGESLGSFSNFINKPEQKYTRFVNTLSSKSVNINEIDALMNEFRPLLNAYIQNTKHINYSQDYIDYMLEFCKNEAFAQCNQNGKCNNKTFFTILKQSMEKLMQQPDMELLVERKNFITSRTSKEDLFEGRITEYDFNEILAEGETSDNIQVRFFAQIFSDKFEQLNLSESEQLYFVRKFYQQLSSSSSISTELLNGLNTNGIDKSYFDELFNIVNTVSSNICHIDDVEIEKATVINSDVLFSNSDKIDAEYIVNNIQDLKFSTDPGVRKFIKMLEEQFDKYSCFSKYTQIDLVNNLIEFINKECNLYSSSPHILSKSAIEKLNSNNAIQQITSIVNSKPFYYTNMISSDGIIDDFYQGHTGDCWLLSGIQSLASTPQGASLIKNAIQWSDDYSSVTVYFAGVDKYVTLSAEEIIEEMTLRYSSGDDDVLILELAMQKVYGDINGDKPTTFWNYFIDNECSEYHTGIGCVVKKPYCDLLLERKHKGLGFAASIAIKGDYSIPCLNGKTFEYHGGAHALAIVDITEDTISFVNPWDSTEVYTITMEQFYNMQVKALSYTFF